MSDALNITFAQLNITVGDLKTSSRKILETLDNAKNSDLVVFPELYLTGYSPEDMVLNKGFLKDVANAADSILAATEDAPPFLLPLPVEDNGHIYNSVYFCKNGKVEQVIYKQRLPYTSVFDEKRIFTAGINDKPITLKGHKIGVLICEDLWGPEVCAALKENGAESLIALNASPYEDIKMQKRLDVIHARISETGLPLAYLNILGAQDDLIFDGNSLVMNARGEITYQIPAFEESVDTFIFPDTEKLSPITEISREESLYKACCLGLRDYVHKNGFEGIVLGLSGGIDSALSMAIAVDSLGAENVKAVMMPSPFTSEESLSDAKACADALGVSLDTIKIGHLMEELENTLPQLTGLAHENMQSRLRGLILMSLSNQYPKYMVLSTGNKSEVAVGYATLYGDMCGGYNAIKDLYKTDVFALSRWRNTKSQVIPENIITKAPTAELRADQKDEDSLPPYPVLDKILHMLMEEDMPTSDIIEAGYEKDTVLKVFSLLKQAEYKRRQAAPGPKLSAKAFGRDRRYPITNKYIEDLS